MVSNSDSGRHGINRVFLMPWFRVSVQRVALVLLGCWAPYSDCYRLS